MTSDESTPWRAHGLLAHDLSLTCPWCAPQVQLSWDADESERTQVMKRDFTKGELREQARDSPRSAETRRATTWERDHDVGAGERGTWQPAELRDAGWCAGWLRWRGAV